MKALVQPQAAPVATTAPGTDEMPARFAAIADIGALGRETLGDRVAGELRALLIAGRLGPGDKLSLRKVAEALGVSMMPVREAVSRLAAEGALEVLPGRAVRVPVLTLSEFRELTRIRLVVEGFAAEEAARRVGPDDIERIAALEQAFQQAAGADPPNSIGAVGTNRDLHFALYEVAGMPLLIDMIERLWLRAGPVLNLDMRIEPRRLKGGSAVQAHAALIAALNAGDPAAARDALVADISSAASHIEATGGLRSD